MAMTLRDLLMRSGSLTSGQVVTVGVAIARELARLHAAGHVYAGVSAEAIAIEEDGRPTLMAATSGGGEPADDLRALVQMLREAAGTDAELALLRALRPSLDAVSFARDLYAVCSPQPLLTTSPVAASRRTAGRLRVIGVVSAAAVVAAFAGVASARSGAHNRTVVVSRPPVPASPAAARPTDWRAVMERLDTA